MFETVSDYPEYSHAELFRLNPINQFLIKKYPREEDKSFLSAYWYAYYFALRVLEDYDYVAKMVPVLVTPEEFYKVPNPRISSCFDKWLEMFKKANVSQSDCIILDNVPGSSEPLSMEVEGIPKESVSAFAEVMDKINSGMIDKKYIEGEIGRVHNE